MHEITLREGLPLSLIYNNKKLPVDNPLLLSKAGYHFVVGEHICSYEHQIHSLRGECLECNQHLLKRAIKEYSQYKTYLFESNDGFYTSLVFATSESLALNMVRGGFFRELGGWGLIAAFEGAGVDLFNSYVSSLSEYKATCVASSDIRMANIFSAPLQLVLATLGNADVLGTYPTSADMFDRVSVFSDSILGKLTSVEVDFLKEHGVSEAQIIDASGMSTREYKAALSSDQLILAVNAYPCNEQGHKIRNINNACVQCKPEKLHDPKYKSKTPEGKFVEKNGFHESVVYDVKEQADKDFKTAMVGTHYLVAINTYRCRKCGMGVRNSNGSCLKCKKSKLKEALNAQ
ncbi:hypothetical protein [Vibrio crassostreae]|uniref:hypothetical protein n=1 Tax=Vibrio crassostreae TaxID=246167 RepID=UPI001B30CF74|nr:hypothetical protein [Vibrio crassostreae]